jgi:hypothetical protein
MFWYLPLAGAALLILGGCNQSASGSGNGAQPASSTNEKATSVEPKNTPVAKQVLPANPQLMLEAEPVSSNQVRFTIRTNLPLPVEVMAAVSLANQKPEDTYIGHDERATLAEPTTVFILDASKANKPLPKGRYEAEVSFYPRWGAEQSPAARGAPQLRAVQTVTLRGSGISRAEAELRNERQKWVMGNVNMNSPWDEGAYVARLGPYEKSPADLSRLHDAYYFPGADMTLIVNRLRGEVTIWRMGRASR